MRITILGSPGNIESSAPGYSKHSGILIDDVLLLDIGEKDDLKYAPTHIFITHLHPDHAAIDAKDLPPKTAIYGPASTLRLPMIQLTSRTVRVDGYAVTPVPTIHSQNVRSVGYVVESVHFSW